MSRLLQDFIRLQVKKSPDEKALISNQEILSYWQLERSSNQLGNILKSAGCKKGDRIGFLIPKSPKAIISILGILKADCIYVPLDPTSPAKRLAEIVESCDPTLILATHAVSNLLDEIMQIEKFKNSIEVGSMDREGVSGKYFRSIFSQTDLKSYSDRKLDYKNSPDDPAYIMFTSGSTGKPKGVVITHSNVFHFVKWANKYFGLEPSDRNSGIFPLHFDLSVYDIFGTLAAGAQLHSVPPELNLLPNKLADYIRTSELTQLFSVPTLLNYMAKLDVVQYNDFPSLKRVIWCGEVLPTPSLVYWMKRLPSVSFTNLYGPTEATIASSYYTVPSCPKEDKTEIPIGTSCEGEELLVLNDELKTVPKGEIGDLYIKGVGLSPGYWRDPEKTRSVFLADPRSSDPEDRIYKTGDLARVGDDGLVYFHGRADSQIKSRGYRIELGEITSAINAMNFIQECVVFALKTDGFEGSVICCAYVCASEDDVTPAMISRELGKILPNYMIPSRWMELQKIPQNVNGKVDYVKLREYLTKA